MFSGKNLARCEGHLEETGSGTRTLEDTLQRCSGDLAGKKRKYAEQEERGASSDRLEMNPKALKLDAFPDLLAEEREAIDVNQAETCKMLIRKFLIA